MRVSKTQMRILNISTNWLWLPLAEQHLRMHRSNERSTQNRQPTAAAVKILYDRVSERTGICRASSSSSSSSNNSGMLHRCCGKEEEKGEAAKMLRSRLLLSHQNRMHTHSCTISLPSWLFSNICLDGAWINVSRARVFNNWETHSDRRMLICGLQIN